MAIDKTIRGTNANNTLRGKNTNDKILGFGGDDRLYGLDGGDDLLGGSGDDLLEGGSGGDRLDGGSGKNQLAGGNGDDLYIFHVDDKIGGESKNGGIDTVQSASSLSFAAATFANFENIILTGGKALTAGGNNRANSLTGNRGANQLFGFGGNDVLIGLAGNDQISGGTGRDTMLGGVGNDTYVVDNSGDRVIEAMGEGKDTIQATLSYSLTIVPNVENLTLFGTAFSGEGNALDNEIIGSVNTNNTLKGGGGDDRLFGQGGADTLSGEDGDDALKGGGGNDNLDGGAGDDELTGGGGNDILVGGGGNDRFIYDDPSDPGQDRIVDFAVAADTIVLDKQTFTALKSSSGVSFSDSSDFARVNNDADVSSSRAFIVYSLQTGNLFYNLSSIRGGAGTFAQLSGIPNLSANNFVIQD